MKSNYSILVNSCDDFEDCWNPFFKLFSKYWPNYNGKIYLNTEYKNYTFKNLDIIPTAVCKLQMDRNKVTWSECLIRAIEKIETDIILYTQEDYFLKDFVQDQIISKFSLLMQNNIDIDCIHLTDQAVFPEKNPSEKYENLYPVVLKQRFRVSCQAALWRKEVLLFYLRNYENAWQFEEFASKRSALEDHKFYVVDNKWVKKDEFEIIPYVFTGIVQGKWKEEVIDLFNSHGIKMDFSKRGFINDAPQKSLNRKVKDAVSRFPVLIKNYKELLKKK